MLLVCGFYLNPAFCQSFEKGDKVISAGIKVSFYKSLYYDENDDQDDGAASYTIPIGFEYALSNRFGIAMELGICNYFTEEDTLTGVIAKANSTDLLVQGNYHWIRGGPVDLYSGFGLGFSDFKYESNDSKNSEFKATGFYMRFSLVNARFYIGKKFALSVHMGIPNMNYNEGRMKDDLGSDYSYALNFVGIDMGTGLVFRF